MSANTVLVGDVGGTNVRFAVASRNADGAITLRDFDKVRGDDHSGFDDALGAYFRKHSGIDRNVPALFALAGPERDRKITLTNRRDWTVDAAGLEREFGLRRVDLVNDYAAMARAVPELPDSAFRDLQDGDPMTSEPVVVSGPGTGIGIATLIPLRGGGYHVLTGEGGHGSYAPASNREAELAEEMRRRHPYVYRELVLAGMGLDPVMEALAAMNGEPHVHREPQEVIDLARAGDNFCREVIELRARGLMHMLGDVALTNGARGGVVITGGVAERIVDWLDAPEALERFNARGVQRSYMEAIPIRLLIDHKAPLVGAAALAFEKAAERS